MTQQMTPDEVRDLYPEGEREQERWFGVHDYGPLVSSVGEVALQVDEEAYQGDSYVLLRDGERWGYLNFGWGSCSGCDWLQGCSSWSEVAELRDHLANSVHWEPSKEKLASWFEAHDWEGDYVWGDGDFQNFLRDAKELLAP